MSDKCPGSVGGFQHGHVYTEQRVKPRGPKIKVCLYCDRPVTPAESDAAALPGDESWAFDLGPPIFTQDRNYIDRHLAVLAEDT